MRSFIAVAALAAVSSMDNGRARTPPMGWRSWNQLGGATTQQSMLAQMAAITDRSRTVGGVPTSLADLGYNDVGLDDYWQACGHYGPDQCTYHNEEGTPVINPQKFPSMLDMTNYGHGLNLTVGWYGNNCGCSDHCNAENFYQGDVSAAFELGFDSIKLDGCGKEYDLDLWAGLLNATGKAYLIENCHWGDTLPNATWCPWSYYRSSGDIRANYGSIVGNLQSVVPLAQKNLSYSGCWAFPDALEVGVYNGPGGPGGDSGLSYAEARSHFAAWCIVSSPLVLGIDMTNKTAMDSVWDILTNTEAIAVNQAYFGSSGGLYNQSGATLHLPIPGVAAARSPAHRTPAGVDVATVQLFAKPLSATSVAVLGMNHGAAATPISFTFAQVPGLPYTAGAAVKVRDIFAHADVGPITAPSYTVTVASHDAAFLVLSI